MVLMWIYDRSYNLLETAWFKNVTCINWVVYTPTRLILHIRTDCVDHSYSLTDDWLKLPPSTSIMLSLNASNDIYSTDEFSFSTTISAISLIPMLALGLHVSRNCYCSSSRIFIFKTVCRFLSFFRNFPRKLR